MRMRWPAWALVVVALVHGTGCGGRHISVPESVRLYERGRVEAAYVSQVDLIADPSAVDRRDAPLEYMRAGSLAMILGDYDSARRLLREAIQRVNDFGDASGEGKALSVFGHESEKLFRGFPYERMYVLTLYGLAHYAADGMHHAEEALAAFRNAIAEDYASEFATEADDGGRAVDFAADTLINHYLSALAHLRLGEPAAAREALVLALDLADRLERIGHPVPPAAFFDLEEATESNLLVVVGAGHGPLKVRTGDYGQALRIVAHPAAGAVSARVVVDGEVQGTTWVFDDLLHQARTRGGREMDRILAGKATFKRSTARAADALIHSGIVVAGVGGQQRSRQARQNSLLAGAGLAVAGLITGGLSAASKPRADVRQLEFLPATFQVLPLTLEPGPAQVRIEFLDADGRPIPQHPPAEFIRDLPEPGWGQALVYAQDGRNEVPRFAD